MTVPFMTNHYRRLHILSPLLLGACTAALAIVLPLPLPAHAASDQTMQVFPIAGNTVITDIKIEGNQRLERETVLSYLTIKPGDAADAEKADTSLKALYATGLFADIGIIIEGSTLIVQVTENPIINRVGFEGNSAIETEDMEKEIQLKSRLVYTLPKVQRDTQRILDLYRRSGRFAATVEPKLVKLEQNRVDVVFEINEGEHTGVSRINFVGNEHYSDGNLRDAIDTRESAWWRFLSTSDFYDPDRTTYDRELLRRFYMNEGYVDARVVSAVAELAPDRRNFFLTFTIEEGQRYKFGKISIISDVKGLDAESLRDQIVSKSDSWYSAENVEKDIVKITARLGDLQYAFANVTPDIDKHRDSQTADITYRIKEGTRAYIGNIDIRGNTRTMDKVIRREFMLAEGDPFNTSKVKRSEQRIRDLGFFEEVKVTPTAGTQPDRSDLDVSVKEKATGEISFGAGFSTTDGPLGDFNIRERNLLGKGQDTKLGTTLSGRTKQFDFSFTEPYFLDRDLTAGVDIFHIIRDNQSESSYDQQDTGFSLRSGFPISEKIRNRVNYTLQSTRIENVPSDASRFIRDQEGESISSLIGNDISYDNRDSRLEPTSGMIARLNTEFSGLGGDRRFFRAKTSATQYYTLFENVVLSGLAEVGGVWGIGQDVRINDRFFLGSDTLRGFKYSGIGPRDMTNDANDALGGNRFARTTAEVTVPLPITKDLGLKTHLFVDAGILSGSEIEPLPTETFMSDDTIRASTGIGITWLSPFGPVRIDASYPFMKESYDETEIIHFSFGTRF